MGRVPPVLVNGTVCVDHLDLPGRPTLRDMSGGAAMYFALAARFDAPVRVLASAGRDYPEHFRQHLVDAGVDLAGFVLRDGATFRWHGRYHDDLDDRDTLMVEYDPAVEALPEVPAGYRDSRFVFMGVSDPVNQLALLDAFPGATLTLADTIDLYIHREQYRPNLLRVLERVDGMLINRHEAADLTGLPASEPPGDLAAAVLGLGPRFVVVKLGPAGSVLRHRDGLEVVMPACSPTPPAGVADPTGAGDTFAAAMLARLARRCVTAPGEPADSPGALRDALAHGAVMASFTIEGVGNTRLLTLTSDELAERHQHFVATLAPPAH